VNDHPTHQSHKNLGKEKTPIMTSQVKDLLMIKLSFLLQFFSCDRYVVHGCLFFVIELMSFYMSCHNIKYHQYVNENDHPTCDSIHHIVSFKIIGKIHLLFFPFFLVIVHIQYVMQTMTSSSLPV
jgi:hypothetical protein